MSFSPDHLERHGTMENYFKAKWKLMLATVESGRLIMPRRIVEHAKRYGMPFPKAGITQIVVDAETPYTEYGPTEVVHIESRTGRVSGAGFPRPEMLPPELSFHNQLNVVASILAVRSLISDAPWNELMRGVATYEWLPYRFQKIGSIQGHPVFNDSKSTNVESTLVALQSLRTPAIVMLGGFPKGESFEPIAAHRDRIGTLIAFGAAGPKIEKDLADLNPRVFPTLKAALSEIGAIARQTPAPIVFSPACSSFDEFKNFEERGAFFNQNLAPLLDKS
jgi:UDP-N-acetylmuramoylalanine--D-glutamate ligase